jgi:hypothetical protein
MSVSRAFDLAQFVNVPANVNDGVVVSALGPPFTTQFKPVVTSINSGVTVGASVPAANAQNQILISGAGPGFAWALGVNPAAAASVPPSTAQYQLIMADATPSWQATTIPVVLAQGGAVTQSAGGTFAIGASLVFTAMASLTKRIDGSDPNFSQLDNFTLDCGTF